MPQGILIGFGPDGKPIYQNGPGSPSTGRASGAGPLGAPQPAAPATGRATGAGTGGGQQPRQAPAPTLDTSAYNPAAGFVGGRGNLGGMEGATEEQGIKIDPLTGRFEMPTGEGEGMRGFIDGATNFINTWASDMNPVPLLKYLYSEAVENPQDVTQQGLGYFMTSKVMEGLAEAQKQELIKAKEAYDKGNIGESAAYTLAGITPLIGPMASTITEKYLEGDTSGALGSLAAVLTPVPGAPMAARGADLARKALAKTGLAGAIDRMALRRVAKGMLPGGGPNRYKFVPLAEKGAKAVYDNPETLAWSRASMADRVNAALEEATTQLDSAYAAVDQGQMFDLTPLREAIEAEIDNISVKGSAVGEIKKGGGDSLLKETTEKTKVPTKVIPQAVADRAETLQLALDELTALGDSAGVRSIAKLARAWGQGAKAQYITDATSDAFKLKKQGAGYADAEQILRKFLAENVPELSEKNAAYSTFKAASDVLKAAEDFDMARGFSPRRSVMLGAAGAIGGAAMGGPTAGMAGGALGIIIDAASRADVTTRFKVAQGMKKLAQTVRNGSNSQIESSLLGLARRAGVPSPLLKDIRQMWTDFRKGKGKGTPSNKWKPEGTQSGGDYLDTETPIETQNPDFDRIPPDRTFPEKRGTRDALPEIDPLAPERQPGRKLEMAPAVKAARESMGLPTEAKWSPTGTQSGSRPKRLDAYDIINAEDSSLIGRIGEILAENPDLQSNPRAIADIINADNGLKPTSRIKPGKR